MAHINRWNKGKSKHMSKKKSKKKKGEQKQTTFINGNTGTSKQWEQCHTGNVKLTDTPIPMYGFGGTRQGRPHRGSIIIDCADQVSVSQIKTYGITLPEELQQLSSFSYQTIKIDWEDGSVPSFTKEFWQALAKYLVEQGKPVHICCMGGHGRTGTALAILLHFMGVTKGYDPIDWVRWKYCEKAVETWSQIAYIEDVCDIKTEQKPSWNTHCTVTYYNDDKKDWDDYDTKCPECGNFFSCMLTCSLQTHAEEQEDSGCNVIEDDTLWVCAHCNHSPCACKKMAEMSEQELADKELEEHLQTRYGYYSS